MSRESFAAPDTQVETTGRRLTFLANSGTRMINGLTVDLDTLHVPVADGSLKPVSDLTDSDMLTVPLLLDHVPSVEAQAGTVTRLWRDHSGLMAEATLSLVPAGEIVRQLAADRALTNSFSITVDYGSQPGKDGIIHNAELVEISVVYRGADTKAAFRSLNERTPKMGTKEMSLDNTIAKFKLSDGEKSELAQAVKDALQDALTEILDAVNENAETLAEPPADENPAPQPPAQSANNRAGKPIIVRMPSAKPTVTVNSGRATWLESPDAFNAFERVLLDPTVTSPEVMRQKWGAFARSQMSETASFGIDNDSIEKLIPKDAITVIEDALNTRGSGIWNLLGNSGLDRLTIGGNITGLTDATRAHGYGVAQYGTEKTNQTVAFVDRKLEADYTYKYITLNKGDIRRTQRPGALLRYILSELPNYIVNTIEKQLVLGTFDDDMKHFRSIMTDVNDTTSDWAGTRFASKIEHGTSSVLLYDFVRASYKVTAPGAKILVTSSDIMADLLLSQDAEGRTLIDLGANGLATRLGVSQIITPEWWNADDSTTALGVIFTPANYTRVGDTSIEAFTNFSLHNNTNEYLQEIYAGGGLSKEKSACAVVPTTKTTGPTTGK